MLAYYQDKAVALRKESVDRNDGKLDADLWVMWSLSARRAWIEIFLTISSRQVCLTSLSARRAWIEIVSPAKKNRLPVVALRKESVDRNSKILKKY